jgi:hypothetical protein
MLAGMAAAQPIAMAEKQGTLICGVCGGEIGPGEPAIQQADGVIVHARCLDAEASWHTTRQEDAR